MPVGFKTTGRLPFFLSLQEHYACEGEDVVPHDEEENGTLNAWLPQGCRLEEKKVRHSRLLPILLFIAYLLGRC